jgi:hypothetical protein
MPLHGWRVTIAGLLALSAPGKVAAQSPPRLDPVAVAPALAELDFKLSPTPPLVVHPSGCLALFDADQSQVVCIDPVSGASHRFGRAGSGPGEFAVVRPMLPTRSGGLLVYDGIRRRFTSIKSDWTLETTFTSPAAFNSLLRLDADSVLAVGGPRMLDVVSVSLRDGGVAEKFPATASDTMFGHGPQPYEIGVWVLPRRSGGWYVASPWHYQILVENSSGVRQSSFGRQLPPELPSPREVEAVRTVMQKGNPSQNIDGFMARFAKEPKVMIAVAPTEDGQGRLWLATGRIRQDSTEIDVFDPSGKFLGTPRVPGEVHAITVSGRDLYVLVEYLAGPHEGAQGVLRYLIR